MMPLLSIAMPSLNQREFIEAAIRSAIDCLRGAFVGLGDGTVDVRQPFLLVDDFVGQGATLANLRGHVIGLGGRVAGFTSLAGKPVSGRLVLRPETLAELTRTIHELPR